MMHHFYDYLVGMVFVCSLLHTLLPPVDILSDFPSSQRYYKLFVNIIGALAISGRIAMSKFYTNGNNGVTNNGVTKDAPKNPLQLS